MQRDVKTIGIALGFIGVGWEVDWGHGHDAKFDSTRK